MAAGGPGAGGVDELLERAVEAMNRGDVEAGRDLAGAVLATDAGNPDAEDLLAAEVRPDGEIRRLTVMFCDLVGSTELSGRLEAEAYRTIVARYQRICRTLIEDRYGGWIVSLKGDGILAAFGFPVPHENDAERAVLAGLEVVDGVALLAEGVAAEHDAAIGVRVAVHKGVVFLDLDERDLYGFAVNVAARLEGLAETGTVLISEELRRLVGHRFDLRRHEPRAVKGVAAPLGTYTVLGARLDHGLERTGGVVVGRAAELAALRAAWAAAVAGRRAPGACIGLVGESGLGKSRLAAALAQEAGAGGEVVVELDGSPFHADHGLWPVRRLLERRCGFTRHVDGAERVQRLTAELDAVGLPADRLPLLAALVGLGPGAGYEPMESDARRLREQVGDAAIAYVEACLGSGGSLLVVEDAQWFDVETRDLVGRLVRGPRADVCVVVTSRDAAALPRGPLVEVLELAPLGLSERLDLLRALGGVDLPPSVQDDLADRSDGVPLFLEELARAALHQGDDPAVAADVTAPRSSGVPEVLYEPLVSRLYVTPGGAALAGAAAAIGREADHDLLAAVSQLSRAEVDDAVTALLGALILERAGPGRARYRFRHELLRAVAYDIQPPTRRRDLHGRVADALVGGAADEDAVDWGRVAEHYEAAGRLSAAADALERAAASARRRGALAEARALLGRAIELVSRAGGPDAAHREVELRLRRGFLAVSLEGNSSPEGAADYERCLELSLGDVGSEALFATLLALCAYYCNRGDFTRAWQVNTVVSGSATGWGAEVDGLVEGMFAFILWYRGEFRESQRWVDIAAAKLQPGTEVAYEPLWFAPFDPRASNFTAVALARFMLGRLDGTFERFAEMRERCERLPFPQGQFTLVGCMAYQVWAYVEVGLLEEAAAMVDEVAALADRHGFDSWAIVAATQRELVAGVRAMGEPPSEARRAELSRRAAMLGSCIAMWKMADQWVFTNYYTAMQGAFHAAAGEVDAALATLEEAALIAARTDMHFYDVDTLRYLALLRPTPADQATGLRAAIGVAREQGAALAELRVAMDLRRVTGEAGPLEAALAAIVTDVDYPILQQARALLASA